MNKSLSFSFDNHVIPRIFKGNWQLSGGHGTIEREQAINDLITYAEHGVTVFDTGDIYTGSEEILGAFLVEYEKRFGPEARSVLRIHTKFVPDLNSLSDLTKQDVRAIIERSLERLNLTSLHLVQFHWWDYDKGDFIQAAKYLEELRREGLIEAIGLTNFDTVRMKQLLDSGVDVKSNQVQFSLLDPRPFNGMLSLAKENNISLFCYGTLAGGLLTDSRTSSEIDNRSHIKYKLMIDEIGNIQYEVTVELLQALAHKYSTTMANVALMYVLQTPGVSSAIIGPRNARHISELDQLDNIQLSPEDYESLHNLSKKILLNNHEDIYSYERVQNGKHGQIMKYNLNGMR